MLIGKNGGNEPPLLTSHDFWAEPKGNAHECTWISKAPLQGDIYQPFHSTEAQCCWLLLRLRIFLKNQDCTFVVGAWGKKKGRELVLTCLEHFTLLTDYFLIFFVREGGGKRHRREIGQVICYIWEGGQTDQNKH